MRSSELINELATALCKAQANMGGAVRGSGNPFFKSKYADLSDVMQVVKEPFADNGLSYVQFPVSTENSVGVSTRLMHTSGQWLEQEFLLPMVKRDPQAGGSCITYARRYGLAAMAGIPQVDDDAEAAMLRSEKAVKKAEKESYEDSIVDLMPSVKAIKDGLATGDMSTANEAWKELTDTEKQLLWKAPSKGGVFTTQERATMKTTEFRQAQ
jgi:hypothetical protein